MYYSKMAASMLQRCVLFGRASAKCKTLAFTVRRCLLSASYLDAKIWEQRKEDPHNLAQLASLMDRTYERKLPVSSLTVSRFIDNVSSKEEVGQAEYYLYKFRHSPNCWYLRDWTVHSWFRKCLKHGTRDRALHTLKNKVQYGVFPDDLTFNLLIDSFVKDEDYKGACAVVEEVMLQEAFDLPSTQIVSLYALAKYLATKPELSWQEERSVGAALFVAGLKQENSAGRSAQLLGCALLGKVEMSRGIHAVYHQMPLIWTPGYLRRALDVMESVCSGPEGVQLSKEALDCLEGVLRDPGPVSEVDAAKGDEDAQGTATDEEDQLEREKLPEYATRFQDLSSKLQSLGRVDPGGLLALVSALAQAELAAAEAADGELYARKVEEWEQERQSLIQRERELRERAQQEYQARQAAKASA
ncbi:28S ribosomal protein S27, mitochondrial [Anguilla anguilla]|uniref:28S ribosomal protein S27, mitochondrial n=1 Tax=Anguilla anguilla TaxID=7936 RepID=UPI0015AF930C|nr:28S ribosomal protein S27, mitochondrial [Anguilla anguilla]